MKVPSAYLLSGAFACASVATAHADDAIRTLVYGYSVDTRAFPGPQAATGSATGQITVSVVQATADGGLVVDVTQSVDRAARPLQVIRCAVYGVTTDVVCDQNVGATGQETALLSFLGRNFYDVSRLDAQGHWRAAPRIKNGALDDHGDFTVTGKDGDTVTIAVDQEQRNGGYRSSVTGTVVYDAAMEIPDSIRLTAGVTSTFGEGDMNVSLTLVSDSMAKTSSPSPH